MPSEISIGDSAMGRKARTNGMQINWASVNGSNKGQKLSNSDRI